MPSQFPCHGVIISYLILKNMYINSIINVDVSKCVEIHIFLVQNLDESIFLIDTILMKEKSEETTTNKQSEDSGNNRHTTHRKNTNKSKDTTQKN